MVYRLPDVSATKAERRGRGQSRRRRVARRTVAVVPTLFTLGNLLCGFISIFIASRTIGAGDLPLDWTPLTFAAVFIFAGMVFDGIDGRIARLTRSSSELGEQLDSMADMVTFGVAPAFLAVQLVGVGVPFISEVAGSDRLFDRLAIVVGGIYVVCAALRLARFNMELEGEPTASAHASFKGLPSPGAAGTVASLILLHQHLLAHRPEHQWLIDAAAVAMVAVMLLVALAMVSSFRYIHVINRYVRGRAPIGTLAKAIMVALLLVVYPQFALAGALVVYALSAPSIAVYRRLTRRGSTGEPTENGGH